MEFIVDEETNTMWPSTSPLSVTIRAFACLTWNVSYAPTAMFGSPYPTTILKPGYDGQGTKDDVNTVPQGESL